MKFTSFKYIVAIGCMVAASTISAQDTQPATKPAAKPETKLGYVSTGFQELLLVDDVRKIAQLGFKDSSTTAHDLQEAVRGLLRNPSEDSHQAAKDAWILARTAYTQTEVFRFIYEPVADWEGKVNAWPIDEGLLDYIATGTAESEYSQVNAVANSSIDVNGVQIDASKLNKAFITETLNELDGVATNVARGFHAAEFLLWGQDLNQTDYVAGQRGYKDFSVNECPTDPEDCRRRRILLGSVIVQLNRDMETPAPWFTRDGKAVKGLAAMKPEAALKHILNGAAEFLIAETAGERMRLAMEQGDPEEEHDCFSDQSHNSHWYNFLGVKNVLTSSYESPNASTHSVFSILSYIRLRDQEVYDRLSKALKEAEQDMLAIREAGETNMHFDQMIDPNNQVGRQMVENAMSSLTLLALSLTDAAKVMH